MTTFVTPLPAPWRQCHAATVAVVDAGFAVAFFAGTEEGAVDTQIWLTLGDGSRWQPPSVVSQAAGPRWNPVLAHGPDGALWLFSKAGSPISAWRTLVRRSFDGGRTWDAERELVIGDVGGRGPVRTPPVVLADGTWLAGGSVESPTGVWDSFLDLSTDRGGTWRRVDIPLDHDACPGGGAIQPAVWASGRTVTALLRTTAGRAWRSSSLDGGWTWAPAEPTNLPNNNSGLAAALLPDGRVLCVHNTSDQVWGPRNELVWSVSNDDGRTWARGATIERLPEPTSGIAGADSGVVTTGESELSYPTVIIDADRIVVSYTWQRSRIAFATFSIPDQFPKETP